jgi:hypothetical protein
LLASADLANHEHGLDEQLTLFKTSIGDLPLKSDFGIFMAGRSDEFVISDMDIFRDAIVLYELSVINGHQRIRVKSSDSDSVVDIPHQMNPCGNINYHAPAVQYTVESPVLEPVIYEYNFGFLVADLVHDYCNYNQSDQRKRKLLTRKRRYGQQPSVVSYFGFCPLPSVASKKATKTT